MIVVDICEPNSAIHNGRRNPWWRHQMETFSALLAICAGNNSPHKGQWRGALMSSLICVWINGWVNNREAGDLRRYRGHYDVIVMPLKSRATSSSHKHRRIKYLIGLLKSAFEIVLIFLLWYFLEIIYLLCLSKDLCIIISIWIHQLMKSVTRQKYRYLLTHHISTVDKWQSTRVTCWSLFNVQWICIQYP